MNGKYLLLPVLAFLVACTGFTPEKTGVVYPSDARAIIDMTGPPYNLDNSGNADCTSMLIRALDDLLKPTFERQKFIEELVTNHPDTSIGFEINKERGVIFPDRLEPSYILYFPDGVYRLSRSIEYSLENLRNTRGAELNRQIHFQGQSEQGTILKLMDEAPGFNEGIPKPVISFMKGNMSNIAMSNTCENLTIDVGSGNPDAIGLHFFANNTGAVRNVTVKSSDPAGSGTTGLAVHKRLVSGCLFKNVTVEGFDTGIEVTDYGIFTVFEHITLINQRKLGFHVVDNVVSVRGLHSTNKVPGFALSGKYGQAVIIDSYLGSGSKEHPAIDHSNGVLYARNIRTDGYKKALDSYRGSIEEPLIREYSSHEGYQLFNPGKLSTLNLPVEEVPYPAWHSEPGDWTCVNDYGALANGVHDDTRAIQAAMLSGKKVVYFQPGKYLIDSTITIPSSVERVNFMYTDLVAGPQLKQLAWQGAFRVTGINEVPLVLEDLFAWESWLGSHFLIDHGSKRELIISDIHTQTGSMYFNSAEGGKVFIENTCCTDEFPKKKCFVFNNQKVWARQINPERANPEIVNNGSDLWIMGFKFEGNGTSIHSYNGGQTEVLGGVINHYYNNDGTAPALLIENASMSFIGANRGHPEQILDVIIRETHGLTTRELHHSDMFYRNGRVFLIPLYRTQK